MGWDFAVARAGNRIKVCLYNFCFLFAFDGYCPDLPLFVLQRKRMDCKSGKLAKTHLPKLFSEDDDEEEGVNNGGLILSMSQRRKDDEGGAALPLEGRLAAL